MRAILCKSLISRLKAEPKPYEIRDTRTAGLLIRVQPSGVMTYYLQIGRGRRIKIGRASLEIDIVREIALDHLADLAKGKDPGPKATSRPRRSCSSGFGRILGDFTEAASRTSPRSALRTGVHHA